MDLDLGEIVRAHFFFALGTGGAKRQVYLVWEREGSSSAVHKKGSFWLI